MISTSSPPAIRERGHTDAGRTTAAYAAQTAENQDARHRDGSFERGGGASPPDGIRHQAEINRNGARVDSESPKYPPDI